MRIFHKGNEDDCLDLFVAAGIILDDAPDAIIDWGDSEIRELKILLLEKSMEDLKNSKTGDKVTSDVTLWMRASGDEGPFSFRECARTYGDAYGVVDAYEVIEEYANNLSKEVNNDVVCLREGSRALARDTGRVIRRAGPGGKEVG